ncbi:uncharacterized protein LOC105182777 [Harpegnathos saltator]|uniref:Uncharacterized protein n=1 Tax=Harpegnathos saltator TaxID=610380 RepID=E2BH48_HARSA|nr:uncharacterized protein LOC105182777 [Harpegnathos saltator]EFN84969.1 hypothetical protein EAI_17308 [Harpegnathos saltator]
MKSRTRILILCLLCASQVLSEEIIEFGRRISVQDKDSPKNATRKNNVADGLDASKYRDKRALGLLLSGLAQIFGYTVTPIQLASLPNPNVTMSAAMPNSTAMRNVTGPQTASSQPMSMNTTAPRRQETIRFTGVVNFGNNSDVVGHLQRYEQIFHGRNNTRPPMMTMTTSRPATSMPKPAMNHSMDLRMGSPTRPPLLTPFFVKIPLPIAPELLATTMSIEDLNLSHPGPLFTIARESQREEEDASPETPVRKEQEMVYKSNEDTERYTVEEKEIYDEKDVMKPVSKYTHRLYVDEPSLNRQQNERYDEVQRKQQEYVARMKEHEAQRNRDQDDYDREDEIKERHRSRGQEIADRNRDHASKYSSEEYSEERRPISYEDETDEESAEEYKERAGQADHSNESSERPAETEERQKTDYPDYEDDESGDKQSGGHKQQENQQLPPDLEKHLEVAYNQQLPIGDYFHESNPEEIRDSYGEVLNNKKQQDDRLSGYFSMFKHPHDYQRIQNPKDASQEAKTQEIIDNGYDEHLKRVEKLREEYALPAPESKYEEYEINNEDEADRSSRQNEEDENRSAARSKSPKTGRVRGKEDVRAKTAGASKNQLLRESEDVKSQEELDLTKYTPLIVPVRYVDANDRVEQASTRRLKYKDAEKKSDNSQVPSDKGKPTTKKTPTPLVTGLPERPRQLHEGEHKELQLWPPPFDYAFDSTEQTNTIAPVNPDNYPLNYYQHIMTNIADNDANNDKSSDEPSGYLVVVGNPAHPYQYPYNVYYFPKDAINPQDQDSHLNAETTHHQHHPHHPLRQNAGQQSTQANLNPIDYSNNHNGSTKNPHNYYYQASEAPADVLDRYRYAFGEYASESSELPNVDARKPISNTENWSYRIHPSQSRSNRLVNQTPPTPAQLQNVKPSNQHTQRASSEQKRYPESGRKRKSPRLQGQHQDNRKAQAPSRHLVPRRQPFDDPQSAHDFFGFSRNDYSFDGESGNASEVAKGNDKNAKESHVFGAPEPTVYHYDENTAKHTDELENDTEKAIVREYRNKVATLKVSEQRRSSPNGPIHYVDFTRNI